MKMLESGYSLIGISSFNASEANERGAIVQAQKVHATVVLTYSKHTGTTSGVMPLTLPDTRVSTTNMMGTAYGSSGGYANYSGMATTTTYGTKTTYIPYTVNRSDYFASYWIKNKPPIFGVHIKAMSQNEVQQIGSNKGLVVNAVVKGSPAFDVDIIKGDVISKIGDFYVYDGETYQRAVRSYQGSETSVVLFRNGQELSKLVKFRTRE